MAGPPPPAGLPRLDPQQEARVAAVARLAAELGLEVFLVGGTVRDLLLGRSGPDLDFVTVGDATPLAAAAARELGGRLVRHPAFLTADVVDGAGGQLDFATARRETYREMAALPVVEPAGLDADLRRRDFTINAMALRLALPGPAAAPPLDPEGIVDPHGGRRDVEAGALRVLHDRSFLDDPTRVLRGVRFELRLGFRFTPETETLARRALAEGAFARLTGGRLRHEVQLLLAEETEPADPRPAGLAGAAESVPRPLAVLDRLADLGLLAAIHPRLTLDAAARARLNRVARELAWYRSAGCTGPPVRAWLLWLMALSAGLQDGERGEVATRLMLAGEELSLVSGFGGRLAAARPRLAAGARPHQVDEALARLTGEELLLLGAEGGETLAWVRRYLSELRPLALAIRGADLEASGVPRGPAIGDALRATRRARLDGTIGREGELAFALARIGASAASGDSGPGGPGHGGG
jgi:tRNA nucleotidyltransferase (CCA-adding enzyme)